jgi:hypothetical protein
VTGSAAATEEETTPELEARPGSGGGGKGLIGDCTGLLESTSWRRGDGVAGMTAPVAWALAGFGGGVVGLTATWDLDGLGSFFPASFSVVLCRESLRNGVAGL